MTSDSDFWACGRCRSINPIRSGRCYSCHTPREVAAIKPTEMPTTGPVTMPEPAEPAVYQPTESRAVLLTVATLIYIVAAGATVFLLWSLAGRLAEGDGESVDTFLTTRAVILAIPVLAGFLALACYGAWISRVVANLPALGGEYSRVSPTFAFVEPLIPGVNVYALPARLAEVAGKLEGSGRGHLLIVIAWGLVVGPPILVGVYFRFIAYLGDDWLRTVLTGSLVIFAIQAIGLLVGLAAVWHVEGLTRRRAVEARIAAAT